MNKAELQQISKLFLLSLVGVLLFLFITVSLVWGLVYILGAELFTLLFTLLWAASIVTIYLWAEGY